MQINEFTIVTGEDLSIRAPKSTYYTSASLTFKKAGLAAVTLSGTVDGSEWVFTANSTATALYTPGNYNFHVMETNGTSKVVSSYGTFIVRQSLTTANTAYDPRSKDAIILEAVIAVMSGTASQTQKSASVGDKSLQYMSFSELAEKRRYFEQKVAAEMAIASGKGANTIYTTFKGVK